MAVNQYDARYRYGYARDKCGNSRRRTNCSMHIVVHRQSLRYAAAIIGLGDHILQQLLTDEIRRDPTTAPVAPPPVQQRVRSGAHLVE
jgi:hypothetical protein